MKKKRMSPYELEEDIFAAVEGRRWATRQNWREVHKEALLLWIEKHKDVASLIPARVESGDNYAHAHNVDRPQNVGMVESAAVVPVSVVPVLTENERVLARLISRRAEKQALLDKAPIELAAEPGSLRALNWLKVMPGILASYDADIAEWTAKVEAERMAKENGGEDVEVTEV